MVSLPSKVEQCVGEGNLLSIQLDKFKELVRRSYFQKSTFILVWNNVEQFETNIIRKVKLNDIFHGFPLEMRTQSLDSTIEWMLTLFKRLQKSSHRLHSLVVKKQDRTILTQLHQIIGKIAVQNQILHELYATTG